MFTRLRDLNVAAKLFAGFGAVCLLLAVVVAVGINRLQSSQGNLEMLSSVGIASVQNIGEVETVFVETRLDATSAALTRNAEETAKELAAMAGHDAALDDALAAYNDNAPYASADDRARFADLLQQYRASREDLVAAAEAGDIDAYISTRDEAVAPIAVEMTELLDDLSSTEVEGAAKLAQRGDRDFRTAVVALLLIGAAAAAVAVVVAVAVSRSIVRPVTRTLEVVQGLSQARLDQRVGHVGDDEIGRLVAAVDLTMDKLTTMVRAIIDSSRTLAGSSEELSAVATQLSSGATQSGSQSQVVSA
ncbi:methyl-accepting chemotaxis protein, partial [Paenibacillus sp. TRM 82003]|uniref:MCP four helix bundle domain-containing protein n=1 Tax=Kineococcus sp. TRM81007 TaxID=2925831 RepID=UPI001F5A4AD7